MPYIGTSPSNGVRRVHTYTATASQTTFTGASSEGVTLSYADTNYIDVFQNGVLLGSADYTSTSGTSVVLAQGASVSDLVVIVVYDVFSVADTVSKTAGGSFDSAVTVNGDLTIKGSNPAAIVESTTSSGAFVQFKNTSSSNTNRLGYAVHDFVVDTNGNEALRIDANGHVTKPLQPAFMAIPTSAQNDFAINTSTTMTFGTEVFDQNADFTSNVFTAPITGRYQINVNSYMMYLDTGASYVQVALVTSNRNYYHIIDPNFSGDLGYYSLQINVLADMDAGDVAYVQVYQSGGTAQMDNVAGSFSAILLA